MGAERKKRGPYNQWKYDGRSMPRSTKHSRSKPAPRARPASKNITVQKTKIKLLKRQGKSRIPLSPFKESDNVSTDRFNPADTSEPGPSQSETQGWSKNIPLFADMDHPTETQMPSDFVIAQVNDLSPSLRHEDQGVICDNFPYEQAPQIHCGLERQTELCLEHESHFESDRWDVINEEDIENIDKFLEQDMYDEEPFTLHLDVADDELENAENGTPPADNPVDTNGYSSNDSSDPILCVSSDLLLSLDEKIKLLLILATKRRHKLTYSAAADEAELAGVLFTDEDSSFLPSRHIMKSAIEKYSFALTEHHVCPFCENYIGTVHSSVFHCDNCDKDASVAVNKNDGNMFLYLPLREQIKALLETLPEELVDPRNRKKINSLNYEDIFDGSIYKLIAAADTITMNLFIDGVQKATSKASAWPVLVTINELSIRLRRKHVLMACLWLSKRKPKCNEYLKPLVKECKELARTGVSFCRNGVTRVLKVKPCCFISDSIARPLIRNSMQFNGRFGCGFCLHPGMMMQCGRGTTRSYTTCDTVYPSRTHEQLMELARSADALGVPQQGIKGVSIVSELPHIDMVSCIDLDSFHAVVNVAKRFCNLWFLSPPRDVPVPAYKIHTNLGAVDKRLLSVTPTSDVSRAPGSLTERSDFRGHEWFYFVLIYSVPLLKNIFPLRYLNHWSLLVKGLAMLMQNSIAKSETVYADRHLQNFVSGIDVLYGAQNVTFSSHLLTHLKRGLS